MTMTLKDALKLREQNDEREKELHQQGAFLSPAARMAAAIEVLVLKLAPVEWEQERSEMLDMAFQDLARAKLTAGLGQGQLSGLADIK